MKHRILTLIVLFIFTACAPKIKSSFSSPEKSLESTGKVVFLDVQHKIPDNAKKLGSAKFGDSGFSTDCSFNSNLIKARELARKNGANMVKVVKSKKPDLWSSCYRMDIDFYFYSGDLKSIPQYQLQID